MKKKTKGTIEDIGIGLGALGLSAVAQNPLPAIMGGAWIVMREKQRKKLEQKK